MFYACGGCLLQRVVRCTHRRALIMAMLILWGRVLDRGEGHQQQHMLLKGDRSVPTFITNTCTHWGATALVIRYFRTPLKLLTLWWNSKQHMWARNAQWWCSYIHNRAGILTSINYTKTQISLIRVSTCILPGEGGLNSNFLQEISETRAKVK